MKYHGGFEAFESAVTYAINDAVDADIETYTRRPGTGKITPGVVFRRNQFKTWLLKPFQTWSLRAKQGIRRCVTGKFPTDSPGDDVGKESVYMFAFTVSRHFYVQSDTREQTSISNQ